MSQAIEQIYQICPYTYKLSDSDSTVCCSSSARIRMSKKVKDQIGRMEEREEIKLEENHEERKNENKVEEDYMEKD